jgi:hypothetical protein
MQRMWSVKPSKCADTYAYRPPVHQSRLTPMPGISRNAISRGSAGFVSMSRIDKPARNGLRLVNESASVFSK